MKKSFLPVLLSLMMISCVPQKGPNLDATALAVHSTPLNTPISLPINTSQPTHTPGPVVNKTSHGKILQDEIWEGEFHIDGDIIVVEGVTLTVMPGAMIQIAANQDINNLSDFAFDLKIGIQNEVNNINGVHFGEPYRDEEHHISIRIEGTLIAVGTPDKMITFTSDSPNPGIYDWGHFEFANGILSYCKVEYYRVLGPGNGTEVSHNILQHIGECGVCANSTVLVEDNTISFAGHELVDMHQSSPVIQNNILGPNPDHAGIVIDGGSPQILNNTITGCSVGIDFISAPDEPTLEGNVFQKNDQDIIYN
jgi:parallel beta-helix repeat protein